MSSSQPTRTEIIAEIKEHFGTPPKDCAVPLTQCARCAIGWLLQDIEYLNARLEVAVDLVGLLHDGL